MANDELTIKNEVRITWAMTNDELQRAINDAADRCERSNDWSLRNPLEQQVAKLLAVQLARAEFGTYEIKCGDKTQRGELTHGGSAEPQPAPAPAQGEGSNGVGSPD